MGFFTRLPGLFGRGSEDDPLAGHFTTQLVEVLGPELGGLRTHVHDLAPAVAAAHHNLDGAIARLDAPVRLSPEDWRADPLVNALFVSMEELTGFVAGYPDIAAFFTSGGTERACFLLTASRREETVLGSETDGQLLRRDVPQTVVTFSDHRCLALAPDEAETRSRLVGLGLDFLAMLAAEAILERRRRRAELSEECRTLAAKLKLFERQMHGFASAFEGHEALAGRRAEAEASLAAAQTELAALRTSDSLAEAVGLARELLTTPAESLRFERMAMDLDESGVKNGPAGHGRHVEFAEFVARNGLRRAAVLASVERRLVRP